MGSWVVFPDPVSPAMITTWCAAIAAASSSLRWLTGSSAGYVITGILAARLARRAAAALDLGRQPRDSPLPGLRVALPARPVGHPAQAALVPEHQLGQACSQDGERGGHG